MKPKKFTKQAPGKVIKTQRGYWAYLPNPLPPKIDWSSGLLNKLSQADRSIAQLAEVGKNFPVPHVVVRPFIKREAILSSRIEGTQTSLQELYAYEARQLSFIEDEDAHEVQNYVVALNYGLNRLAKLPVSQRLISELHARLMKDVRGEYATPGKIRHTQNWIGSPGASLENATFVPPPVDDMHKCLSDLEKYIHSTSKLPSLARIGLIHYQFETIHPFIDGNGRVGRLLVSLLLGDWGLLPEPLLYLSAYFEKYRQDYYDKLLAVSQHGAWEDWMGFFLKGVDIQARESQMRLQKLLGLRLKYRKKN